MSILSAIGLGNDPVQKSLNKLNRNFSQLLYAKSYHHKQNEKLVERQNTIIKRLMSMTNKAYEDNPLVGGNDGVIKDIQTDENKMMALLLGGGLLAAALVGGAGVVKNVKGFFGNLKDKVLGFMGIENNNVEEQEETQETIDQASPSGSPSATPAPISASPQGSTPSAPSAPSGTGPDSMGSSIDAKLRNTIKLAMAAGFDEATARVMGAIAGGESSFNTKAHNTKGLDNSYGLWQINMLGQLGPARRKQFGIRDNAELFDPKTNARAAKMVYDERIRMGKSGFSAWGAYSDGNAAKYMNAAKSIKLQRGGIPGKKPKHFKLGGFVMPEFQFAEGGAVPKAPTSPPVSSAVVATALPIIMHHEALSSLTPGVNDFTFYGKPSVKSKTPWSKSSKPDTPIYAYPDGGGVPTIGWGSIYNDSMMKGSSKVKLGDKWSKKKADDKLKADSLELLRYLRKKHPFYEKMTLQQQAGFLSQHYNTGAYTATDSDKYPKFKAAFRAGKVHEAANAHPRSGGAQFASRIADEQKYMKAGPATYPINTPPVKKRTGGVVNLQQGGSPSSNRLKDAHSAGYMSSMMKKKHIRPVVMIQEVVKYYPMNVSTPQQDKISHDGNIASPSLTAKAMYRHQKGAFT